MRGFDTGPANVLLDLWSARIAALFDADGARATSGTVDLALLSALLDEPYFAAPPPKSTGRDLFDAAWLDAAIARARWRGAAKDAQATLAALTALVRSPTPSARVREGTSELMLCGGGAKNADLVRRIAAELPGIAVAGTDSLGVASDHVEALAFAWLARETLAGRPGNVPEVTGASGSRVLGAVYPR